MGTTVKNLGLAFLASAVMAAPAYGQQQVMCTRDLSTNQVVCPEQHQRVYTPTGPAQQPPVIVEQQPNPVVNVVVGTAVAVGVAALLGGVFNRNSGHGYHNAPRHIAPADIPYRDTNPWSPNYGRCVTARGSVQACR